MHLGCMFVVAAVGAAEAAVPEILLRGELTTERDAWSAVKVNVVQVPVPKRPASPTTIIGHCAAYDLKPMCAGDYRCVFRDAGCVALQEESEHCDDPAGGLKAKLAKLGTPLTSGVCTYIAPGQGYDQGFCTAAATSEGPYHVLCGGNSNLAELQIEAAGDELTVKKTLKAGLAKAQANAAAGQVEAQKQADDLKALTGTLNGPTRERLDAIKTKVAAEAATRSKLLQDFATEQKLLEDQKNKISNLTQILDDLDGKATDLQGQATTITAQANDESTALLAQKLKMQNLKAGLNTTAGSVHQVQREAVAEEKALEQFIGSKRNKTIAVGDAQKEKTWTEARSGFRDLDEEVKSVSDEETAISSTGWLFFMIILSLIAILAIKLNSKFARVKKQEHGYDTGYVPLMQNGCA